MDEGEEVAQRGQALSPTKPTTSRVPPSASSSAEEKEGRHVLYDKAVEGEEGEEEEKEKDERCHRYFHLQQPRASSAPVDVVVPAGTHRHHHQQQQQAAYCHLREEEEEEGEAQAEEDAGASQEREALAAEHDPNVGAVSVSDVAEMKTTGSGEEHGSTRVGSPRTVHLHADPPDAPRSTPSSPVPGAHAASFASRTGDATSLAPPTPSSPSAAVAAARSGTPSPVSSPGSSPRITAGLVDDAVVTSTASAQALTTDRSSGIDDGRHSPVLRATAANDGDDGAPFEDANTDASTTIGDGVEPHELHRSQEDDAEYQKEEEVVVDEQRTSLDITTNESASDDVTPSTAPSEADACDGKIGEQREEKAAEEDDDTASKVAKKRVKTEVDQTTTDKSEICKESVEEQEEDEEKPCTVTTGESISEHEADDDERCPPPPKGSEVFVGGLHRDATEEHIREVFAKIGEIYELRLMRDPKTGQSKGYAFVRYMEPTFAELAADQLNGYLILDRPIGVLVSQDNQSLFVGHISKDWTLEQLEGHLKEAGIHGVHHIIFQKDPSNPARNRGFVFVEFDTHQQAARAHGKMTRTDFRLGGQKVRVDWAEPLNDPGEDVMAQVKSIYVANLPLDVTNDLITSLFGDYGKIERIVLSKNLPTARRKDFAFVNYVERESALKAIEAKNGFEVQGRRLDVTLAKPVEDAAKQAKKGKGGKGSGSSDRADGKGDSRGGPAVRTARGDSVTRGRGAKEGKCHRGGKKQRSPEDEMPYLSGYEIEGLPPSPGPGMVPSPPYALLVPMSSLMPAVLPSLPLPSTGSAFRCELCNLSLNSENQLQQHYQGRQHSKALRLHQQQMRNSTGHGYSPYAGSAISHPALSSPSAMGKRKRIPPAGHQGFARNPRQRSDDYEAIPPPPPMPYRPAVIGVSTYPATPSPPLVPSVYHYQPAHYPASAPTAYYGGYEQAYVSYVPPSGGYPGSGYGAQYTYPQPATYAPSPAYGTMSPTGPAYSQPYVSYVPAMPSSAGAAAGTQRYPGYETMQWS